MVTDNQAPVNWKYATDLVDNKHPTGQINEIITTVYVGNKGSHLNTMEQFYIYKDTKARQIPQIVTGPSKYPH